MSEITNKFISIVNEREKKNNIKLIKEIENLIKENKILNKKYDDLLFFLLKYPLFESDYNNFLNNTT
jgi:hypothetical protein